MAGQRIPGPIGTDTGPVTRLDSGTSARMVTPAPGGLCAAPDNGLHGPAYTLDSQDLGWVGTVDAARALWSALEQSWDHVGRIVQQETGVVVDAILQGILPAVGLALGILAASAVLGTAVGAALGALAGGVGAAPGAVAGGKAGALLGMAALEWLGLGFLVVEIGGALGQVQAYADRATRRAVNSLFVPAHQRATETTLAAQDYARAQAELIKAVLMGLVALLLKSAATRSTARAEAGSAELIAQLRVSRLGEGFAAWVERNAAQLVQNPALRPPVARNAPQKPATQAFTPSQLSRGRSGTAADPPAAAAATAATVNPVKTAPDTAFFWSGRTGTAGGADNAARIAAERGGTTLETLLKERKVQMPDWDATNPQVVRAWQDISAQYAQGASGTVRAVIGQSLRAGNVWETAELPALLRNPSVTRIITVDPATGAESTIFVRGATAP